MKNAETFPLFSLVKEKVAITEDALRHSPP